MLLSLRRFSEEIARDFFSLPLVRLFMPFQVFFMLFKLSAKNA